MKRPIISSIGLAIFAGVALVTQASAIITTTDSFGSGANAFTMDFVNIGNPGNANDTTGYGGVANTFRMSSYEVSEDMINKANTAGTLGLTQDTIGQNGNTWEWMETTYDGTNASAGSARGLRGGAWNGSSYNMTSLLRGVSGTPAYEHYDVGFRVASNEMSPIPEVTSSFTLLGLVSSGLLLRRRTKVLR